jgi:hypothetical protein
MAPIGRVEAAELDLKTAPYPDLMRMLAYWESKRKGRLAPRRADLDPAEIVEFLPRVMLADVRHDPLDFRYRLSGTGILDLHGMELTGRGPRDLMPVAFGELIYGHYCEAVRRREPLLHLVVLDSQERSRSYARLIMPFSEDGSAVTMLMTVDGNERNTKALRKFFSEITRTCALR